MQKQDDGKGERGPSFLKFVLHVPFLTLIGPKIPYFNNGPIIPNKHDPLLLPNAIMPH
jgi:hypothetical protein